VHTLRPLDRWAMPLVSLAFGMINAATLESTGSITCSTRAARSNPARPSARDWICCPVSCAAVVTGHCQKVSVAAVDALCGTLKAAQRAAAATSLMVMCAFACGVMAGTAAMPGTPLGSALARLPPFSALGAVFAGLLLACDWPFAWAARATATPLTPSDACTLDANEVECR
jgi:hypothetical protein